MNLKQLIQDNIDYIILGLCVMSILLLILTIAILVRQGKLKKNYRKFMAGADGKSLEELVLKRFSEIDGLKNNCIDINSEVKDIQENLKTTYQKVGIVKYDAFKEMGGKLSFVLTMLDKSNNGFVLNSVHSTREGCYIYLKEIIKGESFLELSDDEKTSLRQAVNSNNYMI